MQICYYFRMKFIKLFHQVLYGVFLYMGTAPLAEMQFYDRLRIVFMPSKYQPDFHYLRQVRLKRVHMFTLVQLVCFALLWVVKTNETISISFPLMVTQHRTACDTRNDYFFIWISSSLWSSSARVWISCTLKKSCAHLMACCPRSAGRKVPPLKRFLFCRMTKCINLTIQLFKNRPTLTENNQLEIFLKIDRKSTSATKWPNPESGNTSTKTNRDSAGECFSLIKTI